MFFSSLNSANVLIKLRLSILSFCYYSRCFVACRTSTGIFQSAVGRVLAQSNLPAGERSPPSATDREMKCSRSAAWGGGGLHGSLTLAGQHTGHHAQPSAKKHPMFIKGRERLL
jgi:hypothetical protein